MANFEYTDDVYGADLYAEAEQAPAADVPQGASIGKMINLLGAVASVALIAGVGVWGYRLIMRDVSGVPVVRAVEGPMRVQPEDPGGRPADHQGLAVNAVAAQGIAAPTADRLVLAPRPVDLSTEDAPVIAVKSSETEQVVPVRAAEPPNTEADAVTQFQDGSIDALVADLMKDAQPLSETPPAELKDTEAQDAAVAEAEAEAETDEPAKPPVAVVQGPGLTRSLRPVARPKRALASSQSGDSADIAAALGTAVDVSADLDVDPETLPAGTRLAQLGAYDSPEVARVEWDRLNGKFGDYLEGKKRVIQKASSGGRTFYRLRAMGFDDLSDARRFCSALVAENADCIPVTTR